MKKVLSVILSVFMICGCLIIPGFADTTPNEVVWEDGHVISSSNELSSGVTYKIAEGGTVSTASGVDVYLPANATIVVEEGRTLRLMSALIAMSGSAIRIYGTIVNPSHIELQNGATATARVHFPKLESMGLTYKTTNETTGEEETHPRIAVYCYSAEFDQNYINSLKLDSENLSLAYEISDDDDTQTVDLDGQLFYVPWNSEYDVDVPLNQYLFVYAHIIEPDEDDKGVVKTEIGSNKRDCKFDDSKLNVILSNSGSMGCVSGVHYTKVVGACTISCSAWPQKESDLYETYKISFQTGEGYEIVGANGETAEDGDIIAKYGDSYTFKVDIDEDYDKSTYFVYIYNGYGWLDVNTEGRIAAEPDEYGYYHIDNVKGDCTIQVLGVVKNETIDLIGNILESVRNIFNMIKELLDEAMAFFQEMF